MTTKKSKPSGAPKKPETSVPRQQVKGKATMPQTTPQDKTAGKPGVSDLRQLDGVQGRVTELETALQAERQHVQDLQTKMAYLQAEFQNSVKTL